MTGAGLQWHNISRVIKDVASEYAPSVPQKQVHMSTTEIFEMLGYDLWKAFEKAYPEQLAPLVISDYEAHLARQGDSDGS